MLVRGFTHRRTIVMATAGIAMLAPAATASAGLPAPSITAPASSLVPSAPTVAAPPIAAIASSCRGAHRAGGTAVRRAAISCLVNRARGAAGLRGFRGSRSLSTPRPATPTTWSARTSSPTSEPAGRRSCSAALAPAGTVAASARRSPTAAAGLGTPASIVTAWLNSPPHRAILLSRQPRPRRHWRRAPGAPVACGGRGGTFVLDAARLGPARFPGEAADRRAPARDGPERRARAARRGGRRRPGR